MTTIAQREDQELLALYGNTAAADAGPLLREFIHSEEQDFATLAMDLLEQETEAPGRIRLLLLADDTRMLHLLARGYIAAATKLAATVDVWEYLPSGAKRVQLSEAEWSLQTLEWSLLPAVRGTTADDTWQLLKKGAARSSEAGPVLLRRRWKLDPLSRQPAPGSGSAGCLGLFLDLRGPQVWNRFVREEGVHRFSVVQGKREKAGKLDVQVFTGLADVDQYLPPAGIIRPGNVVLSDRCRDYDFLRERVVDHWLDESPGACSEEVLHLILCDLLARRHRRLAEKLMD